MISIDFHHFSVFITADHHNGKDQGGKDPTAEKNGGQDHRYKNTSTENSRFQHNTTLDSGKSSETAMTMLIRENRFVEFIIIKIRPVHFGKIKLRIGRLPG